MAPIDWKLLSRYVTKEYRGAHGRHLLVAPIDWKWVAVSAFRVKIVYSVAIYWWRLLIGNAALKPAVVMLCAESPSTGGAY